MWVLMVGINFSSANAKKWEIELATLKSNNLRLTSALQVNQLYFICRCIKIKLTLFFVCLGIHSECR